MIAPFSDKRRPPLKRASDVGIWSGFRGSELWVALMIQVAGKSDLVSPVCFNIHKTYSRGLFCLPPSGGDLLNQVIEALPCSQLLFGFSC